MKILALSYLYPNSLYPHYGIFVHNRLKAVSKYHEVKVINPIPWFPGCGRLARYKNYDKIPLEENIDGIDVYHPRFFVIPKLFKFIDAFTYKVAVMPLVEKINKSYLFDLIDLHWTYPDLPTGSAIKKKYSKKMLVTLRGKAAFHINEGIGRELLIRKYLLLADAVVGLSQELIDMAVSLGVNENQCHVIRNGVDLGLFNYVDQEESRRHLGLPSNEKIILSVGSLVHGKGFDRIFRSLPKILSNYPNCKFYIIGGEGPAGRFKKQFYEIVEEYALQDNVTFVGIVKNKDLRYWYNAADIFCLASRSEGSPNVLTEALACGCPSVATDVGSVKEIIVSNDLGLVVDNSFDGVTNGLHSMLVRSVWDRRENSLAMSAYDWSWCAQKTSCVYSQVME